MLHPFSHSLRDSRSSNVNMIQYYKAGDTIMITIAVTGGIGAGKSTVTDHLIELGLIRDGAEGAVDHAHTAGETLILIDLRSS